MTTSNISSTALLVAALLSASACLPTGSSSTSDPVTLIEPEPEPEPDPGPTGPARLRIATWNIAFLDLPGESEFSSRSESDYELLEGYAVALEADVVVVQEAAGEDGMHTVFPRAEWSVGCESRRSSQNVCVASRIGSGWDVELGPDYEELAVGSSWLRRGLDFVVSRPGHEPLRVLGIHMKSGCFTGDWDESCGTFFEQLVELEGWIDARATEEVPFVVLGDFNRQMTVEDEAWIELDDADPPRADLTRSIPAGTTPPCWPGRFTEFIDHIVFDVGAAEWLVASGQQPYEEVQFDRWKLRLSDHCPVWADLDIPASE